MKTLQRTITLKTENGMKKYSQRVWELLSIAYNKVEGGLNFNSIEELINSTTQWKIVLRDGNIIAVTIYKAKKGLKIVAFAACKVLREYSIPALINLIKRELKSCYIEVSEKAEEFVLKYCDGAKYIIENSKAKKILNKSIELCNDGLHYVRTIQNIKKQKLLLGTIQA